MLTVTLDGVKLSKLWGHVTTGIKLIDTQCQDPLTGKNLFGPEGFKNIQSHTHCFPCNACIAKDSRKLYKEEFHDLFNFLKQYKNEKGDRVKFVFPQDMSSILKMVSQDGMAKVKKFPCCCCAVMSSKLATPCPKEKCFRNEQCKQESVTIML